MQRRPSTEAVSQARPTTIASVRINSVADAAGAADEETEWSDEVEATAAANPPEVPELADPAEGGVTEVVLVWTLASLGSADTGGATITSVEIQRWNGSTSQWDDIRTHMVSLNDTEPPSDYTDASETYTDTGLEDGRDLHLPRPCHECSRSKRLVGFGE